MAFAHLLMCWCSCGKGRRGLPVDHCKRVELIKDAVPLLWRLLLCKARNGRQRGAYHVLCLLKIMVQQPAQPAVQSGVEGSTAFELLQDAMLLVW